MQAKGEFMRLDLLEDICTLSETEEKTVQLVKNCLDQKFYIKKIMRDCGGIHQWNDTGVRAE